MQQRELQKTSCRELSEKIQGIKKSIGRREKWLFPNHYGGINQSTIRERESERESTGCAMAKGWSTQHRASTSPDKKKCGMSQRCWMMSFQIQSKIL